MGETYKHVGVHYGVADAGFLKIFAAVYRNGDVVGALQTVCNNHGAAHGIGREAVQPGAVQMLQRVFAAARVHGVAVGEEGFAAQLLYHIHHGAGIVGAQKADVAVFAEVHLDGHKLSVQIHVADAGLFNEFLQLHGAAVTECDGVKIGVIYFRLFHKFSPSVAKTVLLAVFAVIFIK